MAVQDAWRKGLASPWAPALLTGLFVFAGLMILDAWNIAPHSPWRAAILGGASGFLATSLTRRLQRRSSQR
ncbi:hypothetical protein [Sphingomonas sp. 2378]|uniref:hypothetical protein n=1 Tax=Sphingomonas sp. 2378 TaxID=1219748 RepID=UPI00311B415A